MESKLISANSLKDKGNVFEDRADAGRKIALKLTQYKNSDSIILAIPSGGVPVAVEIAKILSLPVDLIIVRKVQIPWNTEAGFGAVGPEGEVILNTELLTRLNLSEKEINEQVQKTNDMLRKREKKFRGDKPFPVIANKTVILADDGLASGYTMLSAIGFIKKRGPKRIVVAAPTGSLRTVEHILKEVDELVCLNIRSGFPYAVADAYIYWYDVTDDEVKTLLAAL